MKFLVFMSVFIISSTVFALDPLCSVKQKNVASLTLAQDLGVPVQDVEVLSIMAGMWTEAVGNNVGSDFVTVKAGNRVNRGMTIRTFEVSARQIGATEDCTILNAKVVR